MPVVDPALSITAAAGLALLFLAAGVHKLRAPRLFVATLAAYHLVPRSLAPVAAWLVMAGEFAVGIGLLAGVRIAAWGAVALLATYLLAMGINLARGRRDIDCGCSGPAARQPLSGWLLARNVALTGVAGVLLLPHAERVLGVWDWIIVALALIAATLVYTAANLLLATAPRLQQLRS